MVAMDSTPSSAQIDPPRDADVAPLTAPDRWTGVEDALSRLAHRAAREMPNPPTRTGQADVSAAPPLAEPSIPATPSGISAIAHVAEPRMPVTASNVSAGSQAAEPAAPEKASDVSVAPQITTPSELATVRPAEFRNAPSVSERPSRIRGASRAIISFLIAVCVGVGGS